MLRLVIFTNHAHFLLKSGPAGIAALMHRLLTGYAVRLTEGTAVGTGLHNRKRAAKGPGSGQGFTLLLNGG